MSDLSTTAMQAIRALLLALADDELIFGHRNSEWTGLGPILEEDIAFSSMAQDEIGHAQAYYRLLADMGEGTPDELAFGRTAEHFRNAQLVELPRGDYAFSLVRQALYDTAENVRLDALSSSEYRPLAELARKLRTEERYHMMHARTWLVKLGRANADSHGKLQPALVQLFPYALGLFEPTAWDPVLADNGVQPPEPELQERWLRLVIPLLQEAELSAPVEAAVGGWRILPGVIPGYGGRLGRHTGHLASLLDDMQKVIRGNPGATW